VSLDVRLIVFLQLAGRAQPARTHAAGAEPAWCSVGLDLVLLWARLLVGHPCSSFRALGAVLINKTRDRDEIFPSRLHFCKPE
jgi:hypothetical protein